MSILDWKKNHPDLLAVNINMGTLLNNGIGPVIYDALFYCSFIFILLITGALSWFLYMNPHNHIYALVGLALSLVFIGSVITFFILGSIQSGFSKLFAGKKTKKVKK